MDLLCERSREIQDKADSKNRINVENEVSEVCDKWAQLLSGLESRKDALTKLGHHWEVNFIIYYFSFI